MGCILKAAVVSSMPNVTSSYYANSHPRPALVPHVQRMRVFNPGKAHSMLQKDLTLSSWLYSKDRRQFIPTQLVQWMHMINLMSRIVWFAVPSKSRK